MGEHAAEQLRVELLALANSSSPSLMVASDGRAEANDRDWAMAALAKVDVMCRWADAGYPVVILSSWDDVLELSNTDPPEWLLTSPDGQGVNSPLGVDIGRGFAIVLNWRQGRFAWIQRDEEIGNEILLTEEQEIRLMANVGFVLQARPEGLEIREHRPSPKAMRKQGRRYYPQVEYILQTPRKLHTEPTGVERGPRAEGWTLSVRTLVRGHFRQQAHGPGYSLHKTLWIRPHRRGPEDGPVSIHPMKLETTDG
jgi:hypothetical protein